MSSILNGPLTWGDSLTKLTFPYVYCCSDDDCFFHHNELSVIDDHYKETHCDGQEMVELPRFKQMTESEAERRKVDYEKTVQLMNSLKVIDCIEAHQSGRVWQGKSSDGDQGNALDSSFAAAKIKTEPEEELALKEVTRIKRNEKDSTRRKDETRLLKELAQKLPPDFVGGSLSSHGVNKTETTRNTMRYIEHLLEENQMYRTQGRQTMNLIELFVAGGITRESVQAALKMKNSGARMAEAVKRLRNDDGFVVARKHGCDCPYAESGKDEELESAMDKMEM